MEWMVGIASQRKDGADEPVRQAGSLGDSALGRRIRHLVT